MSAGSAPAKGRRRRPFGGWRDSFVVFVTLLALSLLLDRFNRPDEAAHAGTVAIHDGDTLKVKGESVRLIGIDAPELRQVCRKDRKSYSCGEASRDALIALVAGREVRCTAAKRDRYRRLLGDCRAGRDDLNAAQVRSGWAITYGKGFEAEQAAARSEKLGMWAGSFENPKEWRRRNGDVAEIEFDPVVEWLVRLGEKLGLM